MIPLLTTIALQGGLGVASSAQSPAGRNGAWLFTYTISPTASGRAVQGGEQVMDVAIWRGITRIVVRRGALRSMTGDAGTMLLQSTDSTLAVINPARREVLTGALNDLAALMGGPGSTAPLEVADIQSVTHARGNGDASHGYVTRRVELAQRYTLRVNAPGMKRELRTEQVVTLDISRDIARLDTGFRRFAEQFARSLGLPEPVRRQLRAAERGIPSGFPVRTTTVGVTVAGSDTLRTTTRAELTHLRREAVDTSTFVVPSDYRVTEMTRLLQQRRKP